MPFVEWGKTEYFRYLCKWLPQKFSTTTCTRSFLEKTIQVREIIRHHVFAWQYLFCRLQLTVWEAWGAWSRCTKTCGTGTQHRNRQCYFPPRVTQGEFCTGGKSSERVDCNTDDCPGMYSRGIKLWFKPPMKVIDRTKAVIQHFLENSFKKLSIKKKEEKSEKHKNICFLNVCCVMMLSEFLCRPLC